MAKGNFIESYTVCQFVKFRRENLCRAGKIAISCGVHPLFSYWICLQHAPLASEKPLNLH